MLNPFLIEDTVRAALKEDLGHGHDVTSQAIIPGSVNAQGVLRSRAPGRLAGLIPALTAFSLSDPDFSFDIFVQDGDLLVEGQEIAVIKGPAREMLGAERVGLNFLCHMSGIATLTTLYVDAVDGMQAKICDTRKTLPGLRIFEKHAVLMGGGHNHRFGLDDAILIKDNHIAVAGGINVALECALEAAGHTLKIEIEVDTLDQLNQVLEFNEKNTFGADIVMLDNMDLKTLQKAVDMTKGKIITEASGGVMLETVGAIAKTGVDYISVGALTQSASALDIGLDIEL